MFLSNTKQVWKMVASRKCQGIRNWRLSGKPANKVASLEQKLFIFTVPNISIAEFANTVDQHEMSHLNSISSIYLLVFEFSTQYSLS